MQWHRAFPCDSRPRMPTNHTSSWYVQGCSLDAKGDRSPHCPQDITASSTETTIVPAASVGINHSISQCQKPPPQKRNSLHPRDGGVRSSERS